MRNYILIQLGLIIYFFLKIVVGIIGLASLGIIVVYWDEEFDAYAEGYFLDV